MAVLLGIDIGTSGTKGVLVNADGTVLAVDHLAHTLSLPRPGWAEVDAERTWWGETQALCRRLVARSPGSVDGVAVSGVGPSLVLCDRDLRPLRPAILYGIDTRAGDEIEALTQRYGAGSILASSGKLLTSQALGPKLEWVRRHEPEVWRAAAGWYGSHSFVVAKLTGAYAIDHHTASQCDPLYRVRDFGWRDDWATEICSPLPLPRLAWPSEVVGRVTPTAAAATGLPPGTPVVAGTVDAAAEAFSVGVRHPGDLMVMYGSTVFVVQVLADYRVAPSLWTTTGVDPRTHTLAGGTATAGSLTTWLRSLMGDVGFDTLVAEAAAVSPGADGLLVLPYFAGERTPHFDPDARGVFAGLTLRHTRGHLFRAAYEGIAYGVREILDLFAATTHGPGRTVAVGGGLRSDVWLQIMSDVTGRTQLIPQQQIGAAYGSALLAAIGTEQVAPEMDWAVIDREVVPDPAHRQIYDDGYAAWLELHRSTRPTMHELARAGHRHSPAAAGSQRDGEGSRSSSAVAGSVTSSSK